MARECAGGRSFASVIIGTLLLTLTTTHHPATDLGYLLHKNPGRVQSVDLAFGRAHVAYPEAGDDRTTAALIVEVDAVGLVRSGKGMRGRELSLGHYVNDRPYVASSLLSVAIGRCFGTALSGRSKERPELATTPIDLEVRLPAVPCRGGPELLTRLFAPLGYETVARPLPLDPEFPDWGDSRYLDVTLRGVLPCRDVLEHLFVLLPVLDDDKHYWVGAEEVDKLLRRGGRWLAAHPDRELIAARYLRHDRRLVDDAMARLVEESDPVAPADPDALDAAEEEVEEQASPAVSLNEQRMAAVVAALAGTEPRSIVDLGCGSGKLVSRLLRDTAAGRVLGVDVSHRALEAAARRLHLDTMAPRQRQRVELRQGALTYRDRGLAGFDSATVVEVIEHLDPSRLAAFERVVFAHARPRQIVLTTPNVEYNVRFPGLPAGTLRHRDHRFEWTRAELAAWASAVAERHGYRCSLSGIGPDDPEVGCPTQLAVFERTGGGR